MTKFIFLWWANFSGGLPDGSVDKEPACNAGDRKRGFNPWVRKIPWRRKWQPTPVFLPEKSHGQRSQSTTTYQWHLVRKLTFLIPHTFWHRIH